MTEQPQPNLASDEANLFGTLFAFHKKAMTLLRESSLDDEKMKIVSVRIKTLLDAANVEIERTKQVNLTQRLDAIFEEVKRLVDELADSHDGVKDEKAKPRKARKKKP